MIDSPEEIAEVRALFASLDESERNRLLRFFADNFKQEPVCQTTETVAETAIDPSVYDLGSMTTEQMDKLMAAIQSSKPDSSVDSTTPPLKGA